MTSHMLPALDQHSIYSDPAQHFITADMDYTIDGLYDLDYDLFELCNLLSVCAVLLREVRHHWLFLLLCSKGKWAHRTLPIAALV